METGPRVTVEGTLLVLLSLGELVGRARWALNQKELVWSCVCVCLRVVGRLCPSWQAAPGLSGTQGLN